MSELRLPDGAVVDPAELRWRFSRAGGSGGQGVNTTDSRVELSWDVARSRSLPEDVRSVLVEHLAGRLTDGVVTVRASEHRSQLRNREAALARLTTLLDGALRPPPPPRRPTRASRASRARRAAAELQRREVKGLRRRPSSRPQD
ncbi:aminoacyl-tRNA hydrolase [Cellulomonas sp. APG4]|uniref:alternative ribosome rescue aminoacyl-tRNA hydrolase ArfB n=1 Tax=Cellulomonas sp. APG4 TaxID=1538656 RepID=UPI00137B5F42|nr:alternative ribosome rescue aminoacyl-tRNA hydrolase ArfB [Cellulomonas sp. APG4]NCT89610.1 aminoacyl-tRNA hydrolase [Cellulomonas sp. APG4]